MISDIHFLKKLQEQMRYEDKHDNDIQASPRFWMIMDYKMEPSHEDFADRISYYYNDGDLTEFENVAELKEFILEYFLYQVESDEKEIRNFLENENDFEEVWEWVNKNLNENGFFDEIPIKEVDYIVPNTMFLTKSEAKRHLKLNKHHYTRKAHTYAMTAWRSPVVDRLLKILMEFDWVSIERQYCDGTKIEK